MTLFLVINIRNIGSCRSWVTIIEVILVSSYTFQYDVKGLLIFLRISLIYDWNTRLYASLKWNNMLIIFIIVIPCLIILSKINLVLFKRSKPYNIEYFSTPISKLAYASFHIIIKYMKQFISIIIICYIDRAEMLYLMYIYFTFRLVRGILWFIWHNNSFCSWNDTHTYIMSTRRYIIWYHKWCTTCFINWNAYDWPHKNKPWHKKYL